MGMAKFSISVGIFEYFLTQSIVIWKVDTGLLVSGQIYLEGKRNYRLIQRQNIMIDFLMYHSMNFTRHKRNE